MAVEITQATRAHIEDLLLDIRQADVDEMRIVDGIEPRTGVEQSVLLSWPYAYAAVDAYGAVVAVFGMGRETAVGGSVGVPWLIGTNRMRRHGADLVRLTRKFTHHVLEGDVSVLRNVVWSGNQASIRYLAATGFTFGDPFPVREGETAMVFWTRRADDV